MFLVTIVERKCASAMCECNVQVHVVCRGNEGRWGGADGRNGHFRSTYMHACTQGQEDIVAWTTPSGVGVWGCVVIRYYAGRKQ